MKAFTLAVVLFAGCAAAVPRPEANARYLQENSRAIALRAKQCVLAASQRSRDAVASTGSDPATHQHILVAEHERDQEISKCKAIEVKEYEALVAEERKEYALQAQQEHDRTTLITILTTSGPH